MLCLLLPWQPEVVVQPDLTTPRLAARSFYEAVDRGDEQALRQILVSGTQSERELAEAYSKLIVGAKRMADAAKKRYGDSADALASGAYPAIEIEKLNSAAVNESGDSATVQTPEMKQPMKFRRTPAGWQLTLDDFTQDDQNLKAQIAVISDVAIVFARLADEISQGRYATVQDAESAFAQNVSEAMTRTVREHPPTTAPATQPPGDR
jgi:hypothetical protein